MVTQNISHSFRDAGPRPRHHIIGKILNSKQRRIYRPAPAAHV